MVRDFYNISQQDMANFLGITRSQLSMAEIDQRDLDRKSSAIVLRLFQGMAVELGKMGETKTAKIVKNQSTIGKGDISFWTTKTERRLKKLESKLAQMKSKHERCLSVLICLQSMREKEVENDRAFLNVLEINTKEELKKNGESSQFKMEIGISRVKGELAFLKNQGGL
jgi:transcriptional regulator with XRE-family HTH domain